MFYYEEIENKYYIWTDKTKGKYWPFCWIYVKNKRLWDTLESFQVENYPGYKFAIWFWENKICVINTSEIYEIINK